MKITPISGMSFEYPQGSERTASAEEWFMLKSGANLTAGSKVVVRTTWIDGPYIGKSKNWELILAATPFGSYDCNYSEPVTFTWSP